MTEVTSLLTEAHIFISLAKAMGFVVPPDKAGEAASCRRSDSCARPRSVGRWRRERGNCRCQEGDFEFPVKE